MNDNDLLLRVARMEDIYDRSRAAMDRLLEGAEEFSPLMEEYRQLLRYYQSPQWLADFDADRRGELPQTMSRGVLTEDAVWDLLTDGVRLKELLSQLPPREEE